MTLSRWYNLLSLELMDRVLAFTRTELLQLQLRNPTLNTNIRTVIQVLALAALHPDIFAGLRLGHNLTYTRLGRYLNQPENHLAFYQQTPLKQFPESSRY